MAGKGEQGRGSRETWAGEGGGAGREEGARGRAGRGRAGKAGQEQGNGRMGTDRIRGEVGKGRVTQTEVECIFRALQGPLHLHCIRIRAAAVRIPNTVNF